MDIEKTAALDKAMDTCYDIEERIRNLSEDPKSEVHVLRPGSDMFHAMDCPGCMNTPFTLSPRSETYWSS